MDIGVHLLNGTLGTSHLGGSSHLVFHTGTVDSHVILALGGLHLGLHRLVVGIDLIALLGTHHTLVVETLDAGIRLLGNLETGLSLLQHTIGTLDLLLAGTILRLQLQGCRSTLGTLGLFHLRTYIRGVEDGQRIAHLHIVALLHTEFEDTTGNLT